MQNDFSTVSNIRLEACGNVGRILVLLRRDLGLVVEGLVSESLELLARVLFAFGGGVVVAEGTGEGGVRDDVKGCCIVLYCIAELTRADRGSCWPSRRR